MERKDDRALSMTFGKKQPFKIQGRPIKVGDNHSSITSMAYDPEGKSIAISTFDGSIKLYSPFTGKQTQVLSPTAVAGQEGTPITSVRWRP